MCRLLSIPSANGLTMEGLESLSLSQVVARLWPSTTGTVQLHSDGSVYKLFLRIAQPEEKQYGKEPLDLSSGCSRCRRAPKVIPKQRWSTRGIRYLFPIHWPRARLRREVGLAWRDSPPMTLSPFFCGQSKKGDPIPHTLRRDQDSRPPGNYPRPSEVGVVPQEVAFPN